MNQKTFDGIEFGFRWTADWYEYDQAAEAQAKAARDQLYRELKAEGKTPRKFSLGVQLRSMGGIGSGRPHIEILTRCYGVNW